VQVLGQARQAEIEAVGQEACHQNARRRPLAAALDFAGFAYADDSVPRTH
jgi:hypothetical protein